MINNFKTFFNIAFKTLKIVVFVNGLLLGILFIISFTDLPYYAMYHLATAESGKPLEPKYIVILGGGGMPGESNLIRLYYGAYAASKYEEAKIIIALPGDTTDSLSSVNLMKKDLLLRGCDATRIIIENEGENTRAEALKVGEIIGRKNFLDEILLITSPEHMYRAIKTFRGAGMFNTTGLPAFEQAIESEFLFEDEKLGGNVVMLPEIGKNKTIRYQFWNHLHYEISVIRELFALWFYSIKGWTL